MYTLCTYLIVEELHDYTEGWVSNWVNFSSAIICPASIHWRFWLTWFVVWGGLLYECTVGIQFVWHCQRGVGERGGYVEWGMLNCDLNKLWPMPKHGSIRKVYACLAVTCHLHFWQNDRDFLRATVVTRGWNGYRNKSQHRKSTLEKKILPPFQQGFEPATFQSRVRRSNHWAIPAPVEWGMLNCETWTQVAALFQSTRKRPGCAQYDAKFERDKIRNKNIEIIINR